jgi:UDP:flavonoid glycosyltransferase YjiC (YdhE family)
MNSVHESIAAGTPVLGIPMFVDQLDWAVRVSDAGAGLWLDKTRFGAGDIRAGILTLLEDARFDGGIAALQRAFAEAGGVHRAADLIERTGRGA